MANDSRYSLLSGLLWQGHGLLSCCRSKKKEKEKQKQKKTKKSKKKDERKEDKVDFLTAE